MLTRIECGKHTGMYPIPYSPYDLLPRDCPVNKSATITDTKLAQAIDRYLVFLQAEENKSPLTISTYRQSLNLLLELTNVTDPLLFDKSSIRIYKSALHSFRTKTGSELAIRTKNHHLTILRAFLRYLVQEEELDVYPPDRVTRFKEEQRQVKVLFTDELERLLNAPDLDTKIGKRDSAILQLFFSTGLRLAELRSLN
ncbi:MAG: site-specific integrase, partial [Candidatus Peribacteraceae bacterium]|nr:site-specific integrase [Candidatus Peribacteraceae bacterium]